jgi:hypothetical protein
MYHITVSSECRKLQQNFHLKFHSEAPKSIYSVAKCSPLKFFFGIPSASWAHFRSYLKEKVAAPVWKAENVVVMTTTWYPLSTKVGTNFVDKQRSLGQYMSLMD